MARWRVDYIGKVLFTLGTVEAPHEASAIETAAKTFYVEPVRRNRIVVTKFEAANQCQSLDESQGRVRQVRGARPTHRCAAKLERGAGIAGQLGRTSSVGEVMARWRVDYGKGDQLGK